MGLAVCRCQGLRNQTNHRLELDGRRQDDTPAPKDSRGQDVERGLRNNKLRKVNRALRDQLLDEVLARRGDLAVLDAAGRKYGFSPAVFREEFRQGKDLQRVTDAAGCGIL